jgi:hypothetical protein
LKFLSADMSHRRPNGKREAGASEALPNVFS